MRQAGRRNRLTAEPVKNDAISRQMGLKHFRSHRAAQYLILSFPHLRHAALGDRRDEAIAPVEGAPSAKKSGLVETGYDPKG
jgi:hypothetical protein